MNRALLLSAILIALLCAAAQEAPEKGFQQWTTESLKGFDSRLHDDARQDPHHFAVEQLADFPNDGYLLVHREGDGQVEWHETQVDVFFVQSGSATLLLGGKMLNAETVGPHEKRNGSIEGGTRRKLSAGDVVRIPPRVPHQLLLEGAREFNYFVVKIKGY
jgi:mannose-6-phosphate isomerase-like protein (cupin superfamily)